jgi:hypothetical protein
MTKIFAGDLLEAKFIRRATFPQKFHLHVGSYRFCLGNKFTQGRLGETQHHIGRFDLAAFARHAFNLERSGIVGHDVADLETAVFFVKNIHWGCSEKSGAIIPCRQTATSLDTSHAFTPLLAWQKFPQYFVNSKLQARIG